MTTSTKTTKAPRAKKLLLTSRAKMGRAKAPKKTRTKPERAAEVTQELVDAGTHPAAAPLIAEIMAQVPAPLDLDGTTEAPSLAETIGLPAEQITPSVVLDREPGRGWFHIAIDGQRVGQLFQTTKSGKKLWAATARPFGRDLRVDAGSKTEALDAFVAAIRKA